jgi:hypothetical protein
VGVPSFERDSVPHSLDFFNARFAGGCRAPIFRVRRGPSLTTGEHAKAADAEISSSPDCLGLPSPRNVLPDTITRQCSFTRLKDSVRYQCSLGQRGGGRVPESLEKPQAVGDVSVPDNSQQTVRECGFPRTTPPSPGKEGTEEASNKTRVRELCSRTRVFLGAVKNKKPETSDVRHSYPFGLSDCSSASRRAEVICSCVSCEVSL